ncbi:hypothetical protein IIA16_03880, partial [bacterium]|nr:hypothetical protein [bacterium]
MRLAEYAVACDKEGDTIRGLVWAYLAFRSDRASADVSVIIEGVRDMVGADIPLTSTRQALTDLCRKGMLEGGPDGRGPFLISKKGLDGLKNATSEYEELRGRSFAAWAISEAARLGNPTLVKPLENAADEYIKAAVATLGTSAAASFTGSDDSDGTLYEVLEDVIATHLPRLDPAEARISFSSLMDLGGEEMSAYVGILFEHTIKLLIFRAPNAVRKAIGTSMPRTHLLVDVNVMLAFAGLNKEGEEYPFALRLLALLRRHQGKVVAYVHQESIREWERVIRGARNGLLDGGSSYSSQTSKTILETCNVEGIELAFHRTNAMKFIR